MMSFHRLLDRLQEWWHFGTVADLNRQIFMAFIANVDHQVPALRDEEGENVARNNGNDVADDTDSS